MDMTLDGVLIYALLLTLVFSTCALLIAGLTACVIFKRSRRNNSVAWKLGDDDFTYT